jgi:hypothetical protein
MKLTKSRLKQLIKEELSYLKEAADIPSDILSTTLGGMMGDFKDNMLRADRHKAAAQQIIDKGLWDEYEAMAMQVKKDRPDKFLEPQIYLDNQEHFRKQYPNLTSGTETASKPSSKKAAAIDAINQMHTQLRSLDKLFKKNPQLRMSYEAALAAINDLNNKLKPNVHSL